MPEEWTEEKHVRAVASERAHAARHMFNFLESINAPTGEKSVALEEESYWWGVYDRGAFEDRIFRGDIPQEFYQDDQSGG